MRVMDMQIIVLYIGISHQNSVVAHTESMTWYKVPLWFILNQ